MAPEIEFESSHYNLDSILEPYYYTLSIGDSSTRGKDEVKSMILYFIEKFHSVFTNFKSTNEYPRETNYQEIIANHKNGYFVTFYQPPFPSFPLICLGRVEEISLFGIKSNLVPLGCLAFPSSKFFLTNPWDYRPKLIFKFYEKGARPQENSTPITPTVFSSSLIKGVEDILPPENKNQETINQARNSILKITSSFYSLFYFEFLKNNLFQPSSQDLVSIIEETFPWPSNVDSGTIFFCGNTVDPKENTLYLFLASRNQSKNKIEFHPPYFFLKKEAEKILFQKRKKQPRPLKTFGFTTFPLSVILE